MRPGRYERQLRRRAADLGFGDSAAFLGPQFGDDKDACFRHYDAFILPSFSEGLARVVLEAWSYAKPVVMTRQAKGSGVRDQVSVLLCYFHYLLLMTKRDERRRTAV